MARPKQPMRTIVVAGDVSIDWLNWPQKAESAKLDDTVSNWRQVEGTRWSARPGGAWLLTDLLREALPARSYKVIGPDEPKNLQAERPESHVHSIVDLEPRKEDPDGRKVAENVKAKAEEDGEPLPPKRETPKVYRVGRFRGYCGPDDDASLKQTRFTRVPDAAKVLVLDDSGNGFRKQGNVWRRLLRTTRPDWVIVKMADPLASADTEGLWDLVRQGPLRRAGEKAPEGTPPERAKYAPERLIVVVNAEGLREESIRISQRLSWERTAEDFVREIGGSGKLDTLVTCANLIVRFDCDGTIHHRGLSAQEPILYFDRNHAEGEFVDSQGGRMIGMTAAFTAGLAATLAQSPSSANSQAALREGILAGMTAARRLAAAGFVPSDRDGKPDYPRRQVFASSALHGTLLPVTIPSQAILGGEWWSILDRRLGDPDLVARAVVKFGPAEALTQAPVARFGQLQTADRREIEGFRAIGNLLREYLAKPRSKPISIGVFGPPGSGKSFGVEQVAVHVAKSAAQGREVKKLEFNLSQYMSLDELTAAFHLVRDCALSGNIPLAFFDEFDSEFEKTPMGWLRYFLSPMQSGTFSEGGHEHPLGGAIFIFAGGTRFSMEAFTAPMGEAASDKERQHFTAVKGPDFASRLRGHVDIMSTNQAGKDDKTFSVRRAFVLRSMIKRDYKQLLSNDEAKIDDGVLNALLTVPAFRHGVRSMEAILSMSALSGVTAFNGAFLPPADLLESHVDAFDFMSRVSGERLGDELRENLGRHLHDAYRQKKREMAKSPNDNDNLKSDPAMADWDDLSDDFRESNRLQADDIPRKLRTISCFMAPKTRGRTPVTTFKDKDELTRLAMLEHERFNVERLRRQWRQGPRNLHQRTSPFLTPWRDLSLKWQDVDRALVASTFDVLEKVGYCVYRLGSET